jgi:hypothetical protein
MICVRYIIVNTPHKGDIKYNNNVFVVAFKISFTDYSWKVTNATNIHIGLGRAPEHLLCSIRGLITGFSSTQTGNQVSGRDDCVTCKGVCEMCDNCGMNVMFRLEWLCRRNECGLLYGDWELSAVSV